MTSLSLKTRMAAAVSLLFIFFAAGLAHFALSYFEEEYRKSITSQQFSHVTSLANTIDDKLRITHGGLIADATALTEADVADADHAQTFLDNRKSLLSIFDCGLYLFSKNGLLIAESPTVPRRTVHDFSFREYFKQTIATGKPYISNPFVTTHRPGHPAVMFTAPVFDSDGNLLAILAGSLDLLGQNFLKELATVKIGKTGYFYLLSGDQTYIQHPDNSRISKRDDSPGMSEKFASILPGFEGSMETGVPDGKQLLTSYRHLHAADWILVANSPSSEAYAPLARAKRYFMMAITGGTLAVMTIAWLLMKLYLAPLQAFVRHVRELPGKAGAQRLAAIDSPDEIGTLADAFNTMVATLDQQQAALQENEANFRALADNANDGMVIAGSGGIISYVNRRTAEITGFSIGTLLKSTLGDLAAGEAVGLAEQCQLVLAGSQTGSQYEAILQRNDQSHLPVEVTSARTAWRGEPAVLLIIRDISGRKRVEAALRESERFARSTLDALPQQIAILDESGTIIAMNRAWQDLTVPSTSLIPKVPEGINYLSLCAEDSNGEASIFAAGIRAVIERSQENFLMEHSCQAPDGKRWFKGHVTTFGTGSSRRIVIAHEDITDLKHAQYHIERLAYYNTLTGLPNRLLFHDRLNQALAQSDRSSSMLGVVLLDLDQFKVINETLGHTAGDSLLQEIALRLSSRVRKADTLAHMGGDEFALLVTGAHQAEDVAHAVQMLSECLLAPFIVGSREIVVTASLGIALHPGDGNDAEILLKGADIALYKAKQQGRNCYRFFSAEMNSQAEERMTLEAGLRRALKRDEFLLHYQPWVDLKTGQITGMEALLRWNHPDEGLIPPGKFIPIAEESGLILPMGEWVLRSACLHIKALHDAGFPNLRVAVNLSGQQVMQQDLAELVARIIRETDINPAWLELELTESSVMDNVEHAIRTLHDLKHLGIKLAIDDFGTGYSSLSYLKRFPIDKLKIDRSFVFDVFDDPENQAIIEAIIGLARSLRLRVIAEGVETREQLAYLRERHCDEIQGFFISRPIPTDELFELLRCNVLPERLFPNGTETTYSRH